MTHAITAPENKPAKRLKNILTGAFLLGVSATLCDTYTLEDRGNKFCADLQESFNSANVKFADIAGLKQVATGQSSFNVRVNSTDIGGFIPLNSATCTVNIPTYTK